MLSEVIRQSTASAATLSNEEPVVTRENEERSAVRRTTVGARAAASANAVTRKAPVRKLAVTRDENAGAGDKRTATASTAKKTNPPPSKRTKAD
eukprot:scaffold3998_cov232-Ochromonas_danica.AAC.2